MIKYVLFIIILFSVFNVSAQTNSGSISGKIVDPDQDPIEDATIRIAGKSYAISDAQGRFNFTMATGSYELSVSYIGYGNKMIKVNVEAGKKLSLPNIVLERQSNNLDELVVEGKTKEREIKEQAFNVNVLSTKALYNTSADLGQVLNQSSGVRIREDGGLGSNFNFSLNGFSGRQVKFFLDGIPMDNFGSSLALNNIPVNMAERVEVYKGVLPIHLGADALGGAINIVTRSNPNYLDISYGFGSFNTHKASVNHAYTHEETGFTVRTNAFYNYSDNNYKVIVNPIALSGDLSGQRLGDHEVERFHDGYRSATLQVEAGVTNKSYADRLLLGLIASGNDKDIQTGVTMDQVFGARTTESTSLIPTLKYKKSDLLLSGLDLSLYSAYNMSKNQFIDTTRLRYNWLQETIPTSTAELSRTQQINKDKEALITANLSYDFNNEHALSFNYVMTDFGRKSSDVEDPDRVTFQYPQQLNKQVMGLAWQTNVNNLTATVFSKLYLLDARSFEQVANGTSEPDYQESTTKTSDLGYGAAAAYFVLPGLQAKASYEHTYRLPEAVELLGDGLYTRRNSALKPESSDNINLGALYAFSLNNLMHRFDVEANYIYRNASDYIRLDQAQTQPVDRQYVNIGDVTTNGAEGAIRYVWNNTLRLGLNMTYQEMIDREEFLTITNLTGTVTTPNLGYGYRISNMPYLFGNADLGYNFSPGKSGNVLSMNYSINFVEKYYLTPNHLGAGNQDVIPRQIAHNLTAAYTLQDGKYNISLEARNLSDNTLFDNYKLQKPGRSVFLKLRYFIQ